MNSVLSGFSLSLFVESHLFTSSRSNSNFPSVDTRAGLVADFLVRFDLGPLL